MSVSIPDVRVGEPIVCGGVAVFPLYFERSLTPDGDGTLGYALAQEAMAAGKVAVREVCEAGSVGEVMVDNTGDQPVLFLEGEELRGAKQNRILRSSVLVAAKSRTRIPVICVERGRWRYKSRKFVSGTQCPPSLRHLLKGGSPGAGYGQTRMWSEIQQRHRRLGVQSRSANLSDALDAHRGAAEDLRHRLPCPKGASGIAVVLDGKVVSVDIFDGPATLAGIWDRLVQGLVLDMLEVRVSEPRPCATSISARLYRLREKRWERTDSVGLGERYVASLPEREMGLEFGLPSMMRKPTADDIIVDLVCELEARKALKRKCRTQTLIRLKGDKLEEYRIIKVAFSPAVAEQVRRKYGDRLLEIINEREELR